MRGVGNVFGEAQKGASGVDRMIKPEPGPMT
jgi:hypothetical protein